MRTLSLSVLSLCLSSCVQPQHATEPLTSIEPDFVLVVDSIARGEFAPRSFVVEAKTPGEANDLVFLEFKGQLENALLEAGFGKADRPAGAEMLVEFSYAITDRREETEFQSHTERSGVITGGTSYINKRDPLNPQNLAVVTTSPSYKQESESTSGNTTVNRTYQRTITITAIDARDRKKIESKRRRLWSSTIISEGRSQNWRALFPQILAGAVDYLGKDTSGQKVIPVFVTAGAYQRRLSSISTSGKNVEDK